MPQISMKFVADLARGNKRTIKITSDHIFLAEENTIFKWVTVCTMNVQLLDKYPFIEMKGEEEIQRNMMVYTDVFFTHLMTHAVNLHIYMYKNRMKCLLNF